MNQYKRKIVKKLAENSVGRFVYKSKFRVRGVIKDLSAYGEVDESGNDKIKEVIPSNTFSYSYPDLFGDLISPEYTLGLHHACKPVSIAMIENGRVETNNITNIAVFNSQNYLIEDLCFQFGTISGNVGGLLPIEMNNVFSKPFTAKPKRVNETVFLMLTGGGGIDNYGHWFIDVLSRLHILKESGWYDLVDKFWVPQYMHDFQKETLTMLGIPKNKIINGSRYEHLIAKRLIVTTHPRPLALRTPRWIYKFISSTFFSLLESQSTTEDNKGFYWPLVYVNRSDATWRNVINEEEVETCLQRYGFQSYTLSELSVSQKIKLFAQAKMIVSPTGAGLMNLLFTKPKAIVLELFNESYVHPFYYELSREAGFDYHYMIHPCSTEELSAGEKNVQKYNINVNIRKLESTVRYLLYDR